MNVCRAGSSKEESTSSGMAIVDHQCPLTHTHITLSSTSAMVWRSLLCHSFPQYKSISHIGSRICLPGVSSYLFVHARKSISPLHSREHMEFGAVTFQCVTVMVERSAFYHKAACWYNTWHRFIRTRLITGDSSSRGGEVLGYLGQLLSSNSLCSTLWTTLNSCLVSFRSPLLFHFGGTTLHDYVTLSHQISFRISIFS